MKALQYKKWKIFHHNEEATKQIIEEVFIDKIYDFVADNETPFIIDCGANVGISSLFFKEKYPHCEIVCFEPDPNAFAALTMNIEFNNLSNITLINKALSSKDGEVDFYGHIYNSDPDSRGNSIVKAWGSRGGFSDKTTVLSTRLYINKTVDFLKIDIEGAEFKVVSTAINDIKKFVKKICIEGHVFKHIDKNQSCTDLLNLLSENGFECDVNFQNIDSFLPDYLNDWKKEESPQIIIISGDNKMYSNNCECL
ncbi:MAG: FkbM family methyltransferase [Gammaproteobacteria bacterium]